MVRSIGPHSNELQGQRHRFFRGSSATLERGPRGHRYPFESVDLLPWNHWGTYTKSFGPSVYRPALENRILRIENKLKIPHEERYRSTLKLKKAKNNLITGRRIHHLPFDDVSATQENVPSGPKTPAKPSSREKSVSKGSGLGRSGSLSKVKGKEKAASPAPKPRGKENKSAAWKATGKSVWKGKDGEVNVEELALEHYETLGYKGCVQTVLFDRRESPDRSALKIPRRRSNPPSYFHPPILARYIRRQRPGRVRDAFPKLPPRSRA